ncbi:hypothetical protein H7849_18390 [Alloacidobacterium dinghuense]|uniref:Uncharacterized protein n=1 Tax=Alloacidobacterium dinghuense TaxID=2763107 RepID=A0A7G8BET6_9BACT|nr:hypothetical protein [Alloacidobacterium dinghuense]QNI31056.1 hypothetical protein H7849_18390 [Alloacidobacterium dinghuense]
MSLARAQSVASVDDIPDAPDTALAQQTSDQSGGMRSQQQTSADPTNLEGKQTKRILWIVPNFRSVSVDEKLPPQSLKDKFVTTTLDSFDYSAFIFAGMLAGVAQAENSYPEFHQGAAGYGRYYWHTLADQAVENYNVEFIFPTVLKQDSRYYTLGRGGIIKRTAYSFSRVLITRTDSGNETFNTSEIMGAGSASAISSLYYPSRERTWTKIGQHWLTNVSLDGMTFIFKEFWPDINNAIFHQKQ